MTILNLVFAIGGVALVAAVIRLGYVVAGRELEPRTARAEPRTEPRELRRAA